MLLYYAQIHSNQLEYKDNRKFVKTVTINLLDFCYLKTKEYCSRVVIPSKTENQIELYVLELPKFQISSNPAANKTEAWMTYLCGKQEEEIKKILRKFDKIRKLDDLLENYWKNERME